MFIIHKIRYRLLILCNNNSIIENAENKVEEEVKQQSVSEKGPDPGLAVEYHSYSYTDAHSYMSCSKGISTGFLAYSKINPFAAMLSSGKNPFNFSESSAFSSNTSSATINSLNPSAVANTNPPPSLVTNLNPITGLMKPLTVPSPRQSPKVNPFSSPSPAHNPFVSLVESKDELWKKINGSNGENTSRSNSGKFPFHEFQTDKESSQVASVSTLTEIQK